MDSFLDRSSNRFKQKLAGSRNPAADHDPGGVEGYDRGSNPGADVVTGIVPDLVGNLIAHVGGFRDQRRRDLVKVVFG